MEQCARFFRLTAVGLLGQLLRTQACNQLSSIYIYTIYDFIYIYYFWFRGSWFCVVAAVQTKERARSREKKRTSITYLKLHTILVVIICPPEQSAPKRCSLQTCRQGTVSVSLQQMLPFAAGGAARVCPNCAGKDGARKIL